VPDDPYRLDDALFALQSLIEYVNTSHLLPTALLKRDWKLYECMEDARQYRERAE
jgi:hypothetical protein